VPTTSRNTGKLELLIPSGNTGNLLECNWSSWKFLTDVTTAKKSSRKKLQSSYLEGSDDDYVYFL